MSGKKHKGNDSQPKTDPVVPRPMPADLSGGMVPPVSSNGTIEDRRALAKKILRERSDK